MRRYLGLLDTLLLGTPAFAASQFGFAGVDCYVSDPYAPTTATNYISEVSTFSNIAHLCANNPTDDIRARIDTMLAQKVFPIIDVSNIVFKRNGSLALRSDYQSRWNQFVSLNQLDMAQENIGAVYIADEPFLNNLPYSALVTAVNTVKASLPRTKTMFVEAAQALPKLRVPPNVDLVGFDWYQTDPLSHQYISALRSLEAKLSPAQSVVLAMDGEWPISSSFSAAVYQAIVPNYYTLAQLDPLITMVVTYSWPGEINVGQWGVRDMPAEVQSVYVNIGKAITGR
jgi:hypothetical protein